MRIASLIVVIFRQLVRGEFIVYASRRGGTEFKRNSGGRHNLHPQARRSLETSNREREREIRKLKETTGTGDRRAGEGEGDRSFERSLETGET